MSDAGAEIDAVRALIAAEHTPNGSRPDDLSTWLPRLCSAAQRALPASGVAVSLVTEDGIGGMAAASDPLSAELEELQYTMGEGPSIDAYALRRPVLVPVVSAGVLTRWPGYAPAAHDQGVRAVFAFPLHVGAARLGTFTAYRQRSGPLSDESLMQALTFAEVAVQTLLDGQERAPQGHLADGLDRALDSSVTLYQAQGMVMVDLGVSIADAMARLRAHAYAAGRPLHEVAREVVDGRLTLDRDGP